MDSCIVEIYSGVLVVYELKSIMGILELGVITILQAILNRLQLGTESQMLSKPITEISYDYFS